MDIITSPIFLIAVVVGTGYYWYTVIIKRRNKALEALSGIDAQLQMRWDLIPNILKVAKKFMEHEKEVMTQITALRSQAQQPYDPKKRSELKEHLDVSTKLTGLMNGFMLQVENYPDLKSDQNMLHAQQTYNEVEAQLSAARRFYNSAVNDLNNSVQIFPGNMIANIAKVEAMDYFEAPEEAKGPVDAGAFLNG